LQTVILLLGVAIFALVAYSDVRTRRIPNEFIVAILALAAFRIAISGDPTAALYTLVASAALSVATFLLFWRGFLGGGDVKLMVASGFLIGYHDVLGFLFVMSVSGGLIAVAMLAGDKFRGRATAPDQELHERPARLTIPYGVAISVAGIMTLLVQFLPSG
jgi:prepilin peptidase CpaA